MYPASTSCPVLTLLWNTWMIRGSATLTMVVSRITMKALSAMTTSACQWYGTEASLAPKRWAGRTPSGCANVAIGSPHPRPATSWLPRCRPLRAWLADVDADLDGRPERQHRPRRVDGDLDRHVLCDLGEVAG